MNVTLTFDRIAAELDSEGLEYTRTERGSDREAIDVPGYGEVFYNDQPACWGWHTREYLGGDEVESSVEPAELLADIAELGRMAKQVARGTA